jgi:hypothetical protein
VARNGPPPALPAINSLPWTRWHQLAAFNPPPSTHHPHLAPFAGVTYRCPLLADDNDQMTMADDNTRRQLRQRR